MAWAINTPLGNPLLESSLIYDVILFFNETSLDNETSLISCKVKGLYTGTFCHTFELEIAKWTFY